MSETESYLKLAKRWTERRNKLFAEDKRPTWVAREELEQHPKYRKGYGHVKTDKDEGATQKLFRKLASALNL